jgi:hypothetical protein
MEHFLKGRVKWRKVGALHGIDTGRAHKGGENEETEGSKVE